jgi:sortase A
MASRVKKSKNNRFHSLTVGIGIGLLIMSIYILLRLFRDPLAQEVRYAVRDVKTQESLTPPNTDFAIVIDKIGAASNIVAEVDPYNSRLYQVALRDGVAHAKGTSVPGEGGNIFLFAHSSADLLTAERYNSVFYLIHHLDQGDLIKVWKDGIEYHYEVTGQQLVTPSSTSYLTMTTSEEQLTLMTCWPPGTTLKRLIVTAKRI